MVLSVYTFRCGGGSYVNIVNSVLVVFHTYQCTTSCCFSVVLGFVARWVALK